jgi:hypothetical protein
MTVTALPHPPTVAWVEEMRAAVDVPLDVDSLTTGQARQVMRDIAGFEARIASRKLALARRLEADQVAKSAGASSTGALIAGDFGGDRSAGDRLVRTAKNLQTATQTDAALSAGQISLEQAEIVSRAVAGLPSGLSQAVRDTVERRLISDAKLFTLPHLRKRVLRVADIYADKATADRDENESLTVQEARAWQNTELWFGPARDGLVHFGGKLPEAQFDMIKTSLDAVAAPRRRHLGDDDELTYSQRLGRAFCTWIEHLPTDGFPTTGGTPAMVTVNLDLEQLKQNLETAAPGTLSTGSRLSAGEVRRLACQMGIIPKVLGTQSAVLDQGRSARLFTPPQRLSLAERDLGCVYPGCDRPPGWCEAHHLDHWARDNGPTTVENGALLCAFHHREVHAKNLPMRLRDNSVHIQLRGLWQTNHRWRP